MNLYLVHCGFYDAQIGDGIYESHVNFMVGAESFEAARARAKELPEFREKRMHVDGLQQITAVNGLRIVLEPDATLEGRSVLVNQKHRDLAARPQAAASL